MLVVMPTIGDNIRRLREKAGFSTQTKFAEALGVANTRVSDWENDRYGMPDTGTLLKMATVLKCSIGTLVAGVDAGYERAIRAGLRDLQEALDHIRYPTEPEDKESTDDDRIYEAESVAELVTTLMRERDAASRADGARRRSRHLR